MDENWLRSHIPEFEAELESLRNGVPKTKEVEKLLKTLGRQKVKRGKEPTWKSTVFPHLRPISVPVHGSGKGVKRFTIANILDDIEAYDIAEYQERLSQLEKQRGAKDALSQRAVVKRP